MAILEASKEPTFQVPVQRIAGEINIKDDLLRRFDAAPEKPDEQGLDSGRNIGYLVITRRSPGAKMRLSAAR
jgi:hypothetical protein